MPMAVMLLWVSLVMPFTHHHDAYALKTSSINSRSALVVSTHVDENVCDACAWQARSTVVFASLPLVHPSEMWVVEIPSQMSQDVPTSPVRLLSARSPPFVL